ncbi:MAG: GatB/YqeY domain-containing protein [Brevinematales bacterium]|nr:GatB/YqeY domain-containing protein [Brevinematales bacterium]
MGLFEDILREYIDARKKQDKFVTLVLSMLISDLKYEKIEKQRELEDGDVIAYVQKTIKQKNEVVIEFEKGGRQDLIDKEKNEIHFLNKYLPEMLSEEEIRKIALEIKESTGASSPSDIGKVMKEMMPRVKGKADGALVKDVVTKVLSE